MMQKHRKSSTKVINNHLDKTIQPEEKESNNDEIQENEILP